MGLTFATEAWVVAILHWCELAVQESFVHGLLSAFYVYAGLLQTTLHFLLTAVWPDEREPRRAYFAAVLALSLVTVGCVVDTLPMPTVGPQTLSPGPCYANANVPRMYQALFFSDTPYYLLPAGILLGAVLVQFIIAGCGMYDHERRTGWPGMGWGNALGALLCARLATVFNGSSVVIYPDGAFYLQLFTQPLVSLSVVFLLLMIAFVLFICIDGIALSVLEWRVARGINLALNAGMHALACTVLAQRGMLTPQFVSSCSLCLAVAAHGFWWTWAHPVRRRSEQGLPSLAPPPAPAAPPPAQPRPAARFYVPTHVVTGIDKKGT